MPKESYMMYKTLNGDEGCFLKFSPWKWQGMGDKDPNAEYWVLGAQFLHNYYTIYDFKNHKIGLVESKTSVIGKHEPVKSSALEFTKRKAKQGKVPLLHSKK